MHIKLHEAVHAGYDILHSITESAAQEYAPFKNKIVRGSNKPYVKADMRRVIMKRTRLMKGQMKLEKKILSDINNKEI